MISGNNTKEVVDSRAVSPVVGYVLLIGFILFAATGLFIAAQAFFGADDPRIDANFELEYNESNLNVSVVYDTGDEFDTSNTERLWIEANVIENGNRTIKEITLYNESGVQYGVPSENNVTLREGMVALNEEKAYKSNIRAGTQMEVLWRPTGEDDDFELVIDEFTGTESIPVNVAIDNIDGTLGGSGNIDYEGNETTPTP